MNLWETILRESSKRSRLPEGTVIFFGNSSCEKDKLVEKFCVIDSNAEITRAKTEILSYDFFHAIDSSDDGPVDVESVTRVSLWSLNNQVFKGALDVVLDPSKIEKLVIMIGLDLSKPDECSDQLRILLRNAKNDIESFLNKLTPENRTTYMDTNLAYISTKSPTESDEVTLAKTEKPLLNIGVPIIVVGCKSEFFQVEDAAAMKRAKELQGELRSICMEVGAALLYASAEKDADCTRLHKYLLHRLYPETFSMELSIEDGISDVFIPTGLDSVHLVDIGTGVNAALIPSLSFDRPVEPPTQVAETPSGDCPSELEDEQTWLASLHSYIEQVVAAPIPMSKASSVLDVKAGVVAGAAAPEGGRKIQRQNTARNTPAGTGDHSNLHTEDLKNFFENLLTNNNPPPAKR